MLKLKVLAFRGLSPLRKIRCLIRRLWSAWTWGVPWLFSGFLFSLYHVEYVNVDEGKHWRNYWPLVYSRTSELGILSLVLKTAWRWLKSCSPANDGKKAGLIIVDWNLNQIVFISLHFKGQMKLLVVLCRTVHGLVEHISKFKGHRPEVDIALWCCSLNCHLGCLPLCIEYLVQVVATPCCCLNFLILVLGKQ